MQQVDLSEFVRHISITSGVFEKFGWWLLLKQWFRVIGDYVQSDVVDVQCRIDHKHPVNLARLSDL